MTPSSGRTHAGTPMFFTALIVGELKNICIVRWVEIAI